jgi:hypothetical protein
MDRVMKWAATQTSDSDEAERQKLKSKSIIEGLQNTIKKLEGDVASQQMLCESLAKSFADQISVVRRFGDVHTGTGNTVCGRPHLCILCFRNPVRSVSFPCGHSAICNRCRTMHALDRCPQCAPPLQLQAAAKHMEVLGGPWQRNEAEEAEVISSSNDPMEQIPSIHPQILKLLPPTSPWLGQHADGSVHITGWTADGTKASAPERPTSAPGAVFPDSSVLTPALPHLVFSSTPTRMVRVLAGRTAAGKVQATLAASTSFSSESPFKVTSMKRNQELHSLIQTGIAAAANSVSVASPALRPHSSLAASSKVSAVPNADSVVLKRPASAAPKSR